MKLFEYAGAGLPVIVTDLLMMRQLLETSQNGYCIMDGDPKTVAEYVVKLKENKDLTVQMSRNGKEALDKYFTWESIENRLLSLYQEVENRP